MKAAFCLVLVLAFMLSCVPIEAQYASGAGGDTNVYPCPPCTYNLKVSGMNFTIYYFTGGFPVDTNPNVVKLSSVQVTPPKQSILLNFTVADGYSPFISFEVPRSLIDSRNSTNDDIPFAVFDNGRPLDYFFGCYQLCGTPGRIDERTDLSESFTAYGIHEDPSKYRGFSLGMDEGSHNIEVIGTTVAPELQFPFTMTIVCGILIAVVLTASRLAHVSRFPPQ